MQNDTDFPLVRVELRPSKLLPDEVGLFAIKPIRKDDIVIEADAFNETLFLWSVYKELDEATKQKIMGFCSATEEGFYAPPDFNHLPTNWYMNHSCEPNVGFDREDNFVAMKNIAAGEELVWDYCFNETNPNFKMICRCGTESCRGTITGFDWKTLINDERKFPYLTQDLRDHAKKFSVGN